MMMRFISKTLRRAERPDGGARRLAGRVLSVLALGLLALGGCGDLHPVATFEPERDGAKLFGSLTLDHRAINLTTTAPYDTIRLTATPRNLRGEPLEGLPAPTFRSADTVSVWVTPDGLVKARKTTAGVRVIAEVVTGDNVRHVDTAFVKVTANAAPPQLASLEITFASPEQAEWPMTTGDFGVLAEVYFTVAGVPRPAGRTITVSARDGAGNPVSGLEIDYISLNPNRVKVNRRTGAVEKVVGPPGDQVSFVARTKAFGVVRADTATIKIIGPMAHAFLITDIRGARTWTNKEVVIRPGGVVSWYYVQNQGNSVGIKFEDHTNIELVPELCAGGGHNYPFLCASSGDIAIPGTMNEAHFRRFPQPGLYKWEATDGVQGRVRVVADDDPYWDTARSGQ